MQVLTGSKIGVPMFQGVLNDYPFTFVKAFGDNVKLVSALILSTKGAGSLCLPLSALRNKELPEDMEVIQIIQSKKTPHSLITIALIEQSVSILAFQNGLNQVIRVFQETIKLSFAQYVKSWSPRFLQGEMLENFVLTRQMPNIIENEASNLICSTFGQLFEDIKEIYPHLLIPIGDNSLRRN